MRRPMSFVEIDRKALLYNLFALKKHVGPKVRLMPVVKSNAYGHSLEGVSRLLEKHVSALCTANLTEALFLREQGIRIPIIVLSYFDSDKKLLVEAIRKNIEFVLYSGTMAVLLSRLARRCGKKVAVHLKIDTGTTRVGIFPADFLAFHHDVLSHRNIVIRSCWTHLACAENPSDSFNTFQIDLFWETVAPVRQKFSYHYHIGSSALLLWKREGIGTLGRPGIIVYGLWPSQEVKQYMNKHYPSLSFSPVLTWKTKIIQVKTVEKGISISYDRTYRVKRKTRIAVLPVGYYEGYNRLFSDAASVLIHGQRAPVRGRVCMNLMMVDVTHIPSAREGDEVVLLGSSGRDRITAEELSEISGTISYETVTRIHPGLKRLFV